jgi:hypothetical protein
MNQTEKPWNEKVMDSLRHTGESIRNEAQKLVGELQDPANHERVKHSLSEMGEWAKRTAEEAATMVDQAARKVEVAVAQAAKRAKKPAKKAAKKTKKKAGRSKR